MATCQSKYLSTNPNKYLIQFRSHFSDSEGIRYHSKSEYWWYSERYKKWLMVPYDMPSDGATSVPDLRSNCWWFHDRGCYTGQWECGTKLCNREMSFVLYDIMKQEAAYFKRVGQKRRYYARSFAAYTGWVGTFICGGGAARSNGMFKVKETGWIK